MVRIPTPFPESVASSLGDIFTGGVLDIIWKLFIGVVFLFLIYALAQAGLFGALVAGALFGALFQDDVRAFVVDVWQRDFWVWRV